MKKITSDWTVYRTRFLIRAKQLTEPMAFVDLLGREHVGKKGDYLVESCDGARSIVRRAIFEDVYVPMSGGHPPLSLPARRELANWLYPTPETVVTACGKRAS